MARRRDDKEATLSEVLAEVSLVDFGKLLKQALMSFGCFGMFVVVILLMSPLIDGAADATGVSDLGLPAWALWLVLVWVYVASLCGDRSFHEFKTSWYFPKLGWVSSFLFSAYITGFGVLIASLFELEGDAQKGWVLAGVWGYATPFLLFFSAINIGHRKLIEKRQALKDAG